ncbi:hypothetical protein AAFG07_26090 [Bradyrhizobium sp. B097]|uniref:hypothetical protein n=1 Tax=Bradyrhizobium sp. B097 TaxID=3140244 RepID=UPI003182BD61
MLVIFICLPSVAGGSIATGVGRIRTPSDGRCDVRHNRPGQRLLVSRQSEWRIWRASGMVKGTRQVGQTTAGPRWTNLAVRLAAERAKLEGPAYLELGRDAVKNESLNEQIEAAVSRARPQFPDR